ncbi:MAG: glucose-6-phosphate isomerase [Myxococcales bacterium]|nr:glucose-6-phosphate isomerase [Myxococcales bacterium]
MPGLVLDIPRTSLSAEMLSDTFAAVTESRLAGAHGFWTLPHEHAWATDLAEAVGRNAALRAPRHVVVLGTGGSSLGCKAIATALGMMGPLGDRNPVRLSVCDNIDPAVFVPTLHAHPAASTIVCAISKSGQTMETTAQLAIAVAWLQRELGDAWRAHVVVITDPLAGPLRAFASQHSLLALPVPTNVGGRFSALSAVGLAPLSLAGLDVVKVLQGAARVLPSVAAKPAQEGSNLALALAAWLYEQDRVAGRGVVAMMMYSDLLGELGAWFTQLWAESLGKRGLGATPLICRGTTDQHSLLQLFAEGPDDKAYIVVDVPSSEAANPMVQLPPVMAAAWGDPAFAGKPMSALMTASRRGTIASLAAKGRPLASVSFGAVTPENLGAFMMVCEAACAYAGALYGVNAFDQPGVEDAKQRAHALLRGGAGDAAEAGGLGVRFAV